MTRPLLLATFALAAICGTLLCSTSYSSTGGTTAALDTPGAAGDALAACIGQGDFDGLKMELWKVSVDEGVVGHLGDQINGPYKQLTEMLGARTKIEPLPAEVVGPSIVRLKYAEIHTRGVIVWRFEFFKPADEWKLHAYQFGPLRMDASDPAPPTL